MTIPNTDCRKGSLSPQPAKIRKRGHCLEHSEVAINGKARRRERMVHPAVIDARRVEARKQVEARYPYLADGPTKEFLIDRVLKGESLEL
jgi:hypothetical protein